MTENQTIFIKRLFKYLAVITFAIALIIGIRLHKSLWEHDTTHEDIFYIWTEGQRLVAGENPYARILAGNMRDNDKYATYFPVFYEVAYLTHHLGLKTYPQWLAFWRVLFLIFNVGITSTLFLLYYKRDMPIAALFAAAFWFFNRWVLNITKIAHIEFVTIFFLVLSLALFYKRPRVSLLLFSLSLGIKQIAVFLAPLYLIWTYHNAKTDKLKHVLIAGILIASVPLISSLPFLVWNFEGFIKSLLFSVTRLPRTNFVESVDAIAGWVGIPAKLPLFSMLTLIYLINLKKPRGLYTNALIVMTIFADYNSISYRQYMTWIVPFVPMVLYDQDKTECPKLP